MQLEAKEASKTLAAYGRELYEAGAAKEHYIQAILAAQTEIPHWRADWRAAWEVAGVWRALEPTQNRRPVPARWMHALSLWDRRWEWVEVTVVARLRPIEFIGLRRADGPLPKDLLRPLDQGYVRIGSPKTRWTAARRQHVKIYEVLLLQLWDAFGGEWPPERRLCAGSAAAFRGRWARWLAALGVDSRPFLERRHASRAAQVYGKKSQPRPSLRNGRKTPTSSKLRKPFPAALQRHIVFFAYGGHTATPGQPN